jgi:curved DNA-binding protein CbpA
MKLPIHEAASFMGIELTISKEDLKARYKDLALKYHPDVSDLPNATELIQKLNLAFEILYDNVGSSKPSIDLFFDMKRFANQNEFFADFFKRTFESTPKPTYTRERDDGFNTSPPQSVNGWKRAASGNLWKKRLDITAIIFPDKKHSRFYRAMMINDNIVPSTRKYYKEEFHSEEEAQIWAETYILGAS